MIDTKELLQRLRQRLGIPKSERRLALEVFCRLIAEKLELGEAIEIESLGFFTVKKVKPVLEVNGEYQKIIHFSEKKFSKQNKEYLLLFLPGEYSHEIVGMDSYLNLSFGKPTILSEKINESDFILTTSNDELLSLIESKAEKLFSEGKIHKCFDESEQELIISDLREEILFDAGKQNVTEELIDNIDSELESNISSVEEEKKITKKFDDFELVESDKEELFDSIAEEHEDTSKWIFDDDAIKKEFEKADDHIQTPDGYSAVSSEFSKLDSDKSDIIKQDSGKVKTKELGNKPRRIALRRLSAALAAIIIVAIASGIFLNYEKLKSLVTSYGGQQYQMIETKKQVEPTIISRTNEIPVTYPYDKNDDRFGKIEDTLIISLTAFDSKQNTVQQSLSKEEISSSEAEKKVDVKLIRVQGNIFQRGSEFVVQISSWKSKSKAESELKKFTELGYPTEIMDYFSSDLGKYYKVMVGGFQSLDDAKNFLNQNK